MAEAPRYIHHNIVIDAAKATERQAECERSDHETRAATVARPVAVSICPITMGGFTSPYSLRPNEFLTFDCGHSQVTRATGIVSAFAGSGFVPVLPTDPVGDSGMATDAYLNGPCGKAIDSHGGYDAQARLDL